MISIETDNIDLNSCCATRYTAPMIKSFRHKGLKSFFESGSVAGIQPAHSKRIRMQLVALDTVQPASTIWTSLVLNYMRLKAVKRTDGQFGSMAICASPLNSTTDMYLYSIMRITTNDHV